VSLRYCSRDWTYASNAIRRVWMCSVSNLIIAMAASCSDVARIERITVNNETDYPAQVSVTSAENESWLALTTVRPHSERVVKEVIDQGETWIFRFKYIHIYEEELELARAELNQSEWQVEVPQSFSEALVEMGVEAPEQ
jgi:hypothetical protein